MGWCRITLLPEDRVRLSRSAPALLAQIDEMNREADQLDPLSETRLRQPAPPEETIDEPL